MRAKFLAFAGLVAVAAGPAFGQSGGFTGKWRWNMGQSTMVPGEPPPKAIILEIAQAAGGKLKWTVTETDPSGQPHVESFDGVADGKQRPLQGGEGQTTASFTITDSGLSASFKSPDGASDSWTCSVSGDSRQMTCRGTESDGKGHSEPYTDVYDRA
jgi:hypothetical protein